MQRGPVPGPSTKPQLVFKKHTYKNSPLSEPSDPQKKCEAMQTHAENADVQWNGCKALRKLALDDENQTRITSAGGIEAVVDPFCQNTRDGCIILDKVCEFLHQSNPRERKPSAAAGPPRVACLY